MSSYNLYSLTVYSGCTNSETCNEDECKGEYGLLFKMLKSYPFFNNETETPKPNLIGMTALLKENDGNGYICSYNYLCPYNIVADYKYVDGVATLFNKGSQIATGENGIYIKHQIIDTIDDSDGSVGEISVSRVSDNADYLYDKYSSASSDKEFSHLSVEYLQDKFLPITAITDNSFTDSSIKTIKMPFNFNGIDIGEYAFSGCSEMTEFYAYHGIKSVGDHAFYGCTSLSGNEISCSHDIAVISKKINEEYETSLVSSTLGGLKVCFDCGRDSFHNCSNIKELYFFDGYAAGYTSDMTNLLSQYVTGVNCKVAVEVIASAPFPLYYGENKDIRAPKYKILDRAFMNCNLENGINGYSISVSARNVEVVVGDERTYWSDADYTKLNEEKYVIPRSLDLSGAIDAFQSCGISGTLYFEGFDSNDTIASGAFRNNRITNLGLLNKNSKLISSTSIGDNVFVDTDIAEDKRKEELEKICVTVNYDDIRRIFVGRL